MGSWLRYRLTRRFLLGGAALLGAPSLTLLSNPTAAKSRRVDDRQGAVADRHGGMITVGEVDHGRNGFDPHEILTAWDAGTVSRDGAGRTVREFAIIAEDKEIEIAPGIFFPAWTYNGRVPGPTLRRVVRDPSASC